MARLSAEAGFLELGGGSNLDQLDLDQEGAAIGMSSELEDLKTNLVQENGPWARRRRYVSRRRWMHSPRERNLKTKAEKKTDRKSVV